MVRGIVQYAGCCLFVAAALACGTTTEGNGVDTEDGTGTETDAADGADDDGGDDDGGSGDGGSSAEDADGGDGASGDEGGGCTPGMSISCTCPGGAMGAQVCEADGMSYGECDCGGAEAEGGEADAETGGDDGTGDGGGTEDGGTDETGGNTTTGGNTGGNDGPYSPCEGGCPMGENCQMGGNAGHSWCAGGCIWEGECPDAPSGTATPTCEFDLGLGHCALACEQNADCPAGMECFANALTWYGLCGWP